MYCPKGAHRPQLCKDDEPNCLASFSQVVTEGSSKRNLVVCSAGTYYNGESTCITWPEGYYCTGGTDTGATYTACGSNQYSSTGQTSSAGCTTCASGQICPTKRASDAYYCSAGFVKDNKYCRPCYPGKYCPDGANEYSCTATTNYSPGGKSSCISCPASTECNIFSYIDCTEGFYISAASGGTCTVCPAGYYCQANVKTICPAGTYQPFDGFSFCLECPVQAKCPTAGLTDYTDCATNSEWSTPGSTACTACAANYECFVGYTVPCPSNYYSNLNDFECHKWPEGKSWTSGSQNTQTTCSSGYYSPAGAMNCYPCPAGHMWPSTSMSKPTPCMPGYYQSSTAQTSCTACSDNSYSNIKGATSCLTLPTGHYSGSSHAVSIPCPVGTYPTANYQSCRACTAGYWWGIGEGSATPSYALCPIGFYCPLNSGSTAVVLKPCPAGYYGTSEGAATQAAGCTSCTAGKYCPGGAHEPITCPVNAYCAAGSSSPTVCSSGTYNKYLGQSSSGACIACASALYCAQDATGLACSSVDWPNNSPR